MTLDTVDRTAYLFCGCADGLLGMDCGTLQ